MPNARVVSDEGEKKREMTKFEIQPLKKEKEKEKKRERTTGDGGQISFSRRGNEEKKWKPPWRREIKNYMQHSPLAGGGGRILVALYVLRDAAGRLIIRREDVAGERETRVSRGALISSGRTRMYLARNEPCKKKGREKMKDSLGCFPLWTDDAMK